MKIIIFDLDGTLVKLPIDYPRLKEELANFFGVETPKKSLYRFLIQLRDRDLVEAFRIIDRYELEAINNMWVDPTIQQVMSLLEAKKIALVTLQGLKPARVALQKIGILDRFSLIITREYSLDRAKQIMKVLKELGANPNEAGFIGDQPSDEEAGEKVGITYQIKRKGEYLIDTLNKLMNKAREDP